MCDGKHSDPMLRAMFLVSRSSPEGLRDAMTTFTRQSNRLVAQLELVT